MQIIPVIDLMDGQVVHAVRGERSRYQPIGKHSILCRGNELHNVLDGFLNLYPFKRFYIADLNAIGKQAPHKALIERLAQDYPQLDFWLDQGASLIDIQDLPSSHYTPVIGTESQTLPPDKSKRDFILSLDFKQESAQGHPAWFSTSKFWPSQVIVMTLSRVGSQSGPDFKKLAELTTAYPDKHFIAAGGIRHTEDLQDLTEIGISAALCATALHDGSITTKQIAQIMQDMDQPGLSN